MKKNILILLSLLLTFTAIYAIDIEVGNGTTTTSYLPVNGLFDYSWSNFIVEADYINQALEINQIQFNVSNLPDNYATVNQKLYIKHTSATTVPLTYPNPATTGFTLVYNGAVTWDGAGWQGIMLDTPFAYNGTDNLQLVWENRDGTWSGGFPNFFTTEVRPATAAYRLADGNFPTTGEGISVGYFPNMLFSYDAENEPAPATLLAPANLTLDSPTTVTLEWALGANTTGVDVFLSSVYTEVNSMSPAAMVVNGQNVTSYVATNLENLTTYYWRVRARNSANNLVSNCPLWSFTTELGAGIAAVHVGNGTTLDYNFPFNYFYRSSVSETIYLAEELNIGGQLQGISYYNNFANNVLNAEVHIWVGETHQADLTAYIPSYNLTAVFSGAINMPVGENSINITFDTPYNYTGGNLVVLTQRPFTTNYYESSEVFYTTETALANRSLYWHSDTNMYNPAGMPIGFVSNRLPNATFYFVTEGMGSVAGTVTNGTTGIADVELAINGTNYQATSSADGSFAFPYVPVGEAYVLSASLHGYSNGTATFNVVEDQETQVNLTMNLLPTVAITGQIITNDTGLGIQAHIVLTGYETYEVNTDANGNFTIAEVYANHTYSGTATAGGYQTGAFQVVVGNTNLNLGTIIITESLLPASNVVATLTGNDAVITWGEPIGGGAGEWITKGAEENNDGIGTGAAAVIDAAHKYTEAELADFQGMYINAIKIFPKEAAATYTLKVWGGANGNTQLYSQPVTNFVNNAWNEYTLDSSVAIPATGPVFIGYSANTSAGYPVGCDVGPAVAGGDLIKLNNQAAWDVLSQIAELNINWNIKAFVSWDRGAQVASEGRILLHRNNPEATSNAQLVRGYLEAATNPETKVTRELLGYKVWRLLSANQANEANWTSLTTNMITNLTYTDAEWNNLPSGAYKYAVKVIYTNNNMSPATFSNTLLKDMYGTVDGMVMSAGTPINGATVSFAGNSVTADASGYFLFTDILADNYNITASAPGFASSTQIITVVGTQLTTVDFDLAVSDILISDSFETYPDFALEANPWTLVDGDLSGTYGFNEINYLNSYAPMAYIVFNPAMTNPPINDASSQAHSGAKFMASFAATTSPNNDWLITQEFTLGASGSFNFWGKSIMDEYGFERFKVLVSGGSTNPNDFTAISGENFVEVPLAWTPYSYSLNAYANQAIRVAIQCVSDDAFVFMVDDVEINAPGGTGNNNNEVAAVSQLTGNYPNPFNPETTISFSTKENGPVVIDIFNIKGQKVRTLLNENKVAGSHTVVWNGKDDNGKSVASGVFFSRMKSGKFSSTKKMVLLK